MNVVERMGCKVLLVCGILSSLLYVAMNVFVAMRWEGYSSVSQTVSELSAIGAPTRPLWVLLGTIYTLLVIAFGWGVWAWARRNPSLRIVGGLTLAYGVISLVWPLAPMHLRGAELTLTDTMHIAFAMVTVLLMLLSIGFGAAAFGRRFRLYSIATIVILVAFGVLVGWDGPRIAANLPTPWVGVWERINIGVYLLWVVVLAITLLRIQGDAASRQIDVMSPIKAFIQRRPLLTYFALVFAISWGGILLVIGGPGGIPGTREQTELLLPLVVLAMIAGPASAGILLTGLVDGRAGLRELVSRLLRWRVGARWYAVAFLTTPLLATAALFALLPTSPMYLPGIVASDDKSSLLLTGIAVGLVAGIFEEIGWTGFAVPRLRLRYGVITTGLVVGLLWGAWHFLVAFWGSGTSSGAFSLPLFLPQFLFYVGVLPAYRVLMVWVYDRTGSLLVAMLMHASLTGSVLFVLMPPAISGAPLLTWYLALAAALWAVVAVVTMADGGQLSRKPLRRRLHERVTH